MILTTEAGDPVALIAQSRKNLEHALRDWKVAVYADMFIRYFWVGPAPTGLTLVVNKDGGTLIRADLNPGQPGEWLTGPPTNQAQFDHFGHVQTLVAPDFDIKHEFNNRGLRLGNMITTSPRPNTEYPIPIRPPELYAVQTLAALEAELLD